MFRLLTKDTFDFSKAILTLVLLSGVVKEYLINEGILVYSGDNYFVPILIRQGTILTVLNIVSLLVIMFLALNELNQYITVDFDIILSVGFLTPFFAIIKGLSRESLGGFELLFYAIILYFISWILYRYIVFRLKN